MYCFQRLLRIKEDVTSGKAHGRGAWHKQTNVSHLNPSEPHICLQNEGVGPHDLEHLPVKHITTELNCMPDAGTTMMTKTDTVLLSCSLHSSQEDNKQIAPGSEDHVKDS